MPVQNASKPVYTNNGWPTAKWLLITLLLALFSVYCLLQVFYLASRPLKPTAAPAPLLEEAQLLPPDFRSFDLVEERKSAFFEFFTPLIREENAKVLQKRQRVLQISEELQTAGAISNEDRAYIEALVLEYRFEEQALSLQEQIDKLLLRVDKIPASMVLAQAATESAWGTSRFAVEGNNYFGQWCFRRGCGTVPLERSAGMRHEVAVFSSPRDSVRAYFRNINTHRAYRPMREMRAALRQAGKDIIGLELIKGLGSYSERGQEYIRELRRIIAVNQLAELDRGPSLATDS